MPEEEAELESPQLYALSPQELDDVAKVLRKLDELYKENAYAEIPERLMIRNQEDWMVIGYAVRLDDGWFFESITEELREEIGGV